VLPEAMGIEGLVVKGASSGYVGGRLKVNSVGVHSARRRRRGAFCLVRWLASGGLLLPDRCRGPAVVA
jgi:hypothetical protein